jgi:hypothetical protein
MDGAFVGRGETLVMENVKIMTRRKSFRAPIILVAGGGINLIAPPVCNLNAGIL